MTEPILLVEDDENDVFFMQEAFRKAGVKNAVRVARDGREALECLRDHNFKPGLIILDLKLPFIMGLDVLRSIRGELGLVTVVIVMSASGERADVTAAYRAGANAYLVKPSETARLMDIVKAIQAFWLSQNIFSR
jgi:two-component system response regulator